jgi:hypothetical protein
MAQRWAQQKLDRNRTLRDRKMGRVTKRHYFPEIEPVGLPSALPTSLEVKQLEREAIALCNLKAKRGDCTGRLDDVTRRSRDMRKARGAIVRPESGRIAVQANKIAAPPMKGFLQSCWQTHDERARTMWSIVKKD